MEQENSMMNDFNQNDQTGDLPSNVSLEIGNQQANQKNESAEAVETTETKLFDKANERSIPIPGRHATPEEWQNFYRQLGTPDSAEDYYLPLPQGDSGEFAQAIAPILHSANITQEQASALAQGWNELQAKQMQAYQDQLAQQEAAAYAKNQEQARELEQEWQDRYDANVEFARRAKAQFLPADQADAIVDALESAVGLKATMKILSNIGRGLSEDTAAGLGRANTASPKDAASILFGRG